MDFKFTQSERTIVADLVGAVLSAGESGSVAAAGLRQAIAPQKIVAHLEKLLVRQGKQDQRRVRRLLGKLASPVQGLHWKRRLVRFQTLPLAERQRVVQRLLRSRQAATKFFVAGLLKLVHYHAFASPQLASAQRAELWEAIGYAAPITQVANTALPRPAQIRIEQQTFAADYLVVGSGAGGSVVAAELAETGKRVILVDAGPLPHAAELGQSEEYANRHWLESWGTLPSSELPVSLIAGRVFGGGTVINWGTCLNPPAELLNHWANQYGFQGCLSDSWQHSLYSVRRRLGITSAVEVTSSNRLLAEAATRLGWSQQVLDRNQGSCEQCLTCSFGCASGKQDALRTYVLDAERLGVHLIPDCRIELIEHEQGRADRATGRYRDAEGQTRDVEFRFRHLVLAAGAIHTPALLLRSGLGNRHVGQHLQLHPAAVVLAEFEEQTQPWKGPPQSTLVDQFKLGDRRTPGFRIEAVPLQPGLLAMSLPWHGSADYWRTIQRAGHLAAWLVLVHDQDGRSGKVELDHAGQPRVGYRVTADLRGAISAGVEATLVAFRTAGAKRLLAPVWGLADFDCSQSEAAFAGYLRAQRKAAGCPGNLRLFSAHQMSSCRLASSAAHGAIDPTGRVFGTENVYVCDGSGLPTSTGVNPALTITTLSHYLAQQIKTITGGL